MLLSVNFIYHQTPKKVYFVSALFFVFVIELFCYINNETHNQWTEKRGS